MAGKQHDSSAGGVDFSSLMYEADRAQQASRNKVASGQQAGWEHNTMMNSNLSNVIDNIQDDGPARSTTRSVGDSIQDDEAKLSQAAVNRHDEFIREQMARENPMSEVPDNGRLNRRRSRGNTMKATLGSNKYQLLPMLLLLVVTTVMLAVNMRTESRLDSLAGMVDATHVRDVDNEPGVAILSATSGEIPEIDARLATLGQDIHELRTTIDKQIESLQSMKTEVEQAVTQKLTQDSDIQFGDTLLVQKKLVEIEQQLANMSVPAAMASTPRSDVMSDALKTEAAAEPMQNVWAVNIASLSDSVRAQAVMQRLQDAGYSSKIQVLQRDDTTLYRLSVGGFTSVDEAEQFIEIAKTRFGFEGGWIQNG